MSAPKPMPFKYYIHDMADSFRIQILGDFTGSHVSELDGCWETAKSSVAQRKLVIDIRGLRTVDSEARRWLDTMSDKGASLLSDPRGPYAHNSEETPSSNRQSLIGGLVRQEQ